MNWKHRVGVVIVAMVCFGCGILVGLDNAQWKDALTPDDVRTMYDVVCRPER